MPQEVPQPEIPQKPRISVVVVSYNCEDALRRCLRSLEASKQRAQFEVLVVDAGSQDGCPSVDLDFPAVTVLRLPRNFGKTRARNIGMRTAQSDVVFFLDPHVEVRPETLGLLAAALESRDDATAAAPVLEDANGAVVPQSFRLPSVAELAETGLRGTPLPRAAVTGEAVEAVEEWALAVRRSFVAGMNYLDEKRFSEHWSLLEVCWQIRNAGKKLLLVDAARATIYPFTPIDADKTDYVADRITGAGAYIAKHKGLGTGISFRIKCFLSALGSLKFSLAFQVITGQKLDPTQ
ncbi:MAG TPA: glycosyltransferase [Paludibaculum sp.]